MQKYEGRSVGVLSWNSAAAASRRMSWKITAKDRGKGQSEKKDEEKEEELERQLKIK